MLASLAVSIPLVSLLTYLAIPGSSIFSWHPFFMSISYCTVMCVAADVISTHGWNPLRSLSRSSRLQVHWYLALTAAGGALLGLAAIYWNKQRRGAPHFTSWHGQCGLATVAWTICQLTAGLLLLLYRPSPALPRLLSRARLKRLHALSGACLVCTALYTVALALNSAWFQLVAPSFSHPVALLLLIIQAVGLIYRLKNR